ncbi:MAG: peptidoglycan-binding domain-containing protein [Pseudolabrys sp.]
MAWRMAKSLEALLATINTMSPHRDKLSDGGIGNAEHASRSSDHNPWVMDGAMGVVTARDFTNDPAHGIDSEVLANALLKSKDPRIKYVISNKKIASGDGEGQPAWQWRPYPVPPNLNPHNHHCHISVKSDKAHYDSTAPWTIDMTVSPAAAAAAAAVVADPVLRMNDNGADVIRLQKLLNAKGAALDPDGKFGKDTKDAVTEFQTAKGLFSDGVAGKYTWEALKA